MSIAVEVGGGGVTRKERPALLNIVAVTAS
jgi:hypothetical protein